MYNYTRGLPTACCLLALNICSHKEQGDRAWQIYRALEDSSVSEVFMGQLKSTLQCSVCRGASVTFDPFWDVCLPIPKKVWTLLSLSLSPLFSFLQPL